MISNTAPSSPTEQALADAIASLMVDLIVQYNAARSRAEAAQGPSFDEAQFHEWFTTQVRRV